MQREKQVQIPELLWVQLMAYVLVPELRDKLDPEVRKGIEAKLDRQIAHDLYSKYPIQQIPHSSISGAERKGAQGVPREKGDPLQITNKLGIEYLF